MRHSVNTYFIFLCITVLLLVPVFSSAQDTITDPSEGGEAFVKFLNWLFSALLSTAAILAFAMIVIGGFMWIGAAGNPGTIDKAKDMIKSAFLGLILAFASWLILNTINPALVAGNLPGGGGGGDGDDAGIKYRCENAEASNRGGSYETLGECEEACSFRLLPSLTPVPVTPICVERSPDDLPFVYDQWACSLTNGLHPSESICLENCDTGALGGKKVTCKNVGTDPALAWQCQGGTKWYDQEQCDGNCINAELQPQLCDPINDPLSEQADQWVCPLDPSKKQYPNILICVDNCFTTDANGTIHYPHDCVPASAP